MAVAGLKWCFLVEMMDRERCHQVLSYRCEAVHRIVTLPDIK